MQVPALVVTVQLVKSTLVLLGVPQSTAVPGTQEPPNDHWASFWQTAVGLPVYLGDVDGVYEIGGQDTGWMLCGAGCKAEDMGPMGLNIALPFTKQCTPTPLSNKQ